MAVIGDAFTAGEAREFQEIVDELEREHPHKRYVVVPKCRDAFDILDDNVVLGYPLGFSELEPEDFSSLSDWRGRDLHLLGSNPNRQWEAMQKMTTPTLTGENPANIVGVDTNFYFRAAYLGEYWSRDGYQPADHLSIRETVRKSLQEIKGFWQDKSVWPETEPREIYGEAVEKPDLDIFYDRGGDPIGSREDLEHAVIREYEEHGKMAFQSDHAKKRWEYYEGLEPV